jgi:hypothetical protein
VIVDRYYYAQLNKQEQAIYKAFYKGVMAHEDIIPIPIRGQLSKEVFNKIFLAMTRDNPLIYYVNQSACNWATDMFGHTAICPQYFYNKDTVKKYNRNIEKTVNNLAGQLRLTEGTDYEKELRVHDWFCKNVSYDFKGTNMDDPARVVLSHNIVGVFAKQKAQCEGIAKAVKVLLNAVDIKCIVATGDADANGSREHHAWNVVDIDGNPYQVDVTWDIGASKGRVSYDYFNVTDEIIGKTHKLEDKVPECTSLKDNYFERNKLTFKSKSQLIAYITREITQGQTEFYFRLDGMFMKMRRSELAGIVTKLAAGGNGKAVRVQQVSNEKVGTCWIRIY